MSLSLNQSLFHLVFLSVWNCSSPVCSICLVLQTQHLPWQKDLGMGILPQAQPLAQDLQRCVPVTANEITVQFHPLSPKNLSWEWERRLCWILWIGSKGVVLSHSTWRNQSWGLLVLFVTKHMTLFNFGGEMDLITLEDFSHLSDSIKFISTCTTKKSGAQFQFLLKGPALINLLS